MPRKSRFVSVSSNCIIWKKKIVFRQKKIWKIKKNIRSQSTERTDLSTSHPDSTEQKVSLEMETYKTQTYIHTINLTINTTARNEPKY